MSALAALAAEPRGIPPADPGSVEGLDAFALAHERIRFALEQRGFFRCDVDSRRDRSAAESGDPLRARRVADALARLWRVRRNFGARRPYSNASKTSRVS